MLRHANAEAPCVSAKERKGEGLSPGCSGRWIPLVSLFLLQAAVFNVSHKSKGGISCSLLKKLTFLCIWAGLLLMCGTFGLRETFSSWMQQITCLIVFPILRKPQNATRARAGICLFNLAHTPCGRMFLRESWLLRLRCFTFSFQRMSIPFVEGMSPSASQIKTSECLNNTSKGRLHRATEIGESVKENSKGQSTNQGFGFFG